MRTFYYDLLQFLGQNETAMEPKKMQENFNHTLTFWPGKKRDEALKAMRINVHFHWLNCRVDIDKEGNIRNNYKNSIADLETHFAKIGVCSRRNETLETSNHRFAVVIATGICEADRSNHKSFKDNVATLLNYVYEQCWAPSVSMSSSLAVRTKMCDSKFRRDLFLVKLEESIDPKLRMYSPLLENNWHTLNQTLPQLQYRLRATNNRMHVPVLDTFHVARSFKLFNDSIDGIHFYSERRKYIGNVASQAVLKFILSSWMAQAADQFRCSNNPTPTLPTDSGENIVDVISHADQFPRHDTVKVSFSDGRLIRVPKNKNKFYLILNGKKHIISNYDTFSALGLDWRSSEFVSHQELDAFEVGPAFLRQG